MNNKNDNDAQICRVELSDELQSFLADDRFNDLKRELLRHDIVTLEEFAGLNLWAFMNRFDLYSIGERVKICHEISDMLANASSSDERYELKTASSVVSGHTPAEVLLRFLEEKAKEFPLKIRALINMKNPQTGSVVLSKETIFSSSIRMSNPVAYINAELCAEELILHIHWICAYCGITERPELYDKQAEQLVQQIEETTQEDNQLNQTVTSIIADSDLEGITFEELYARLDLSRAQLQAVIDNSVHIVLINGHLILDEALTDYEEGAAQIEHILEKLLSKNHGYVSSHQLFQYASAEMQMFLNDNGFDCAQQIFDFTRHLFEKINYHGKQLYFSHGVYISYINKPVNSINDIVINYAKDNGNVINTNTFERYLKMMGLQKQAAKRPLDSEFLLYDNDETNGYSYVLKEAIGMTESFFQKVYDKIIRLFEEYGYEDHIVIRNIPSRWFSQLPQFTATASWTPLLLQSLIIEYGTEKLNGLHTIFASDNQFSATLHAMVVTENSRVQSFADAIIATLIDNNIPQRTFQKEELRRLLVTHGLISEYELRTILANATDERFVWDDAQRNVVIKV